MNITIIHKEPIVDRIPNLKSFIVYASTNDHKITLLTTKSKVYPEPTFLNENIKYITVNERNKKWQLPTFIRFYVLCLVILLKKINQKYSLILAGKYALILGSIIGNLKLKKFCSFIIEYPELNEENRNNLSLTEKLEILGVRKSQFLITHDQLHAEFIAKHLHIEDLDYTTIPNGTIGNSRREESHFLHQRLGIGQEKRIILHAGGFGPWFGSDLLAKESVRFSDKYELVFHVSHNISNDAYFKEYLGKKDISDKSLFSMEPVSTDALDELISSAYIGIAWYSTDLLGFRATMLGMAAGKIGNYLKCGIPVIVPHYESFDYISHYSCGIRISSLKELNEAVKRIAERYSDFSTNALLCYNKIWKTEKSCEALLNKLEYSN